MSDLFLFTRKKEEDGTTKTTINIHPVLSFVLIACVVLFFTFSCDLMFGK